MKIRLCMALLIVLLSTPVMVAGGTRVMAQVSPTPAATGAPQDRTTLTEAQEKELHRLKRWYDAIVRYDSVITGFMNNYNQALGLKNSSSYGSLLPARQYLEEMKKFQDELQAMVPDDSMRNGHMKLVGAFHMMTQCLVLVPPPQDFQARARQDLLMGQSELEKWKSEYTSARSRFLKSLNI